MPEPSVPLIKTNLGFMGIFVRKRHSGERSITIRWLLNFKALRPPAVSQKPRTSGGSLLGRAVDLIAPGDARVNVVTVQIATIGRLFHGERE